ncbi:MAG TPA: glycosyltransferase family A protein [Burkholderiales bacterium]|nr:glycosyltransferase family A protein [Burkholderiales bacterium]
MLRDLARRRRQNGAMQNEAAKVSIVIPTLCQGRHLSHLGTLWRLLHEYLPQQTHSNYEAMVYCDGPNSAVDDLVKRLDDSRVTILHTDVTTGLWGHPQTRAAIRLASGEFFVRMNDDNRPYPHYLRSLVDAFEPDVGLAYARVMFKGDARHAYADFLRDSFLIPGDGSGRLANGNIDCMCYAVRTHVAQRHVEAWSDAYAADWRFVETLLAHGVKTRFIDTLIGEKC